MQAGGNAATVLNAANEVAVHRFLRAQNDPRPSNRDEAEEAANLAATKDAWPRTIAFLKKQMGVK